MMQQLPRRNARAISAKVKKDYNYRDIIEQNISLDEVGSVVLSKDDLDYDMTILKKIIDEKPLKDLKFLDFESVRYVDCVLNNRIDNTCFLVDDSLRVSREYIDLTKIKNIDLIIPLNYLVWGVKFNDRVRTYCFKYDHLDFIWYSSYNGNKELSYEDLIKINGSIESLDKLGLRTDIDKVYLVSDYLQSRTQFISGTESESNGKIFITPTILPYHNYCEKSGLVETVLNERNGVCMGISNLSTLLLNNPLLDVETESVNGSNHVWNKVLIDGKCYYFDNTWSITRSESPHPESLITLDFSRKYLLLGSDTLSAIGHHERSSSFVYTNAPVSNDDYGPHKYGKKFCYQRTPMVPSSRKK